MSAPRLRIALPSLALGAGLVLALAAPARSVGAQSLRGSEESVDRMYDRARARGLTFYQTSRSVKVAAREGEFVQLRGNRNYRLAGIALPYVKSTTRAFVEQLAAEYRDVCNEQLVITSAVRPESRQRQLRNGSPKSVHPTGMAVDLRKPAHSGCREWLRDRLLDLEARGVIEATEEFHPPHFHVAVFSASRFALNESRADDEN